MEERLLESYAPPRHPLLIKTLTFIIAVQCLLVEQFEGTHKIQILI